MVTPKKIFFAYSNEDEDLELYKKIHKHFAAYRSVGLLGIIDKSELFKLSGDKSKILEILNSSDITIPLLSIDFINDEDCLKQLESAAAGNKVIVPILLRDFDWEAFQNITRFKNQMLPADHKPVENRITEQKNDDTVFKEIAQNVKAIMFPEIGRLRVQKSSNTFYYILAALVFIAGIVASVFTYQFTGSLDSPQQQLATILILLLFTSIGLIALKNVLFPNKLNLKS